MRDAPSDTAAAAGDDVHLAGKTVRAQYTAIAHPASSDGPER